MNTLEAIKTRRSCRKYKQTQIKESELKIVLEAGTYAASSFGKQDALIVAVQREDLLSKIRQLNKDVWLLLNQDNAITEENKEEQANRANKIAKLDTYYGAPTIVLVFASQSNENAFKDGSLVLGNMMLAAHEIGLASCWINREDQMFETKRGKELLKEMNLPENLVGIGALALGYWDAEPKQAKERKENYYKII